MAFNKSSILALLLLAVGIGIVLRPTPGPVFDELPQKSFEIVTPAGQTHSFTLEIASTPEQLRDGLMFRQSLAPDAGMLFVFVQTQPTSFWMKNTLIPLDMLFIREDGTIAKVHANAQPNDETGIPSGEAVRGVIEIAGGRAGQLGITPGSKVLGLPWLDEQK